MSVAIHEMMIDDYDDVIALWRSDPGVGLSDADSRKGIAAYLENNPGMPAVARDGDGLVGAVLCGHDGRRGYITHLAVADSRRREGIGRELTEWCMDRLREHGIDKCHVLVFGDNGGALAYWRAAGWIERTDLTLLSKLTAPDGRDL